MERTSGRERAEEQREMPKGDTVEFRIPKFFFYSEFQ